MEIEEQLGVSRKVMADWQQNGLVSVQVKRARWYPLWELLGWMRQRAVQRQAKSSNEWALLRAEFDAKERKLKFETRAGVVIDRDAHEAAMETMAVQIRASLLSMIPALVQKLTGKPPAEMRRELERNIRWQLEQMADGRVVLSASLLRDVDAAVKRAAR